MHMPIPASTPRVACVVAFIIAALTLLLAALGPVSALVIALIPLMAGIGILRRRVWSAYGFALYQFSQGVMAAVLLLVGGSQPNASGLAISIAFSIVLGGLFLLAGRSLAASGAARGWALPWFAVAAVCTLPLLFLQTFVIPTGAMEPTLLVGDRLFARRFPKPAVSQGDMIVFIYPVDRKQTFVKRVIGMPGDRIRLVHKAVYRNGVLLQEPYAVHRTDYEDLYRDDFPAESNVRLPPQALDMLARHVTGAEVIVPDGSYFVLGDNRDVSLDSRYWGFVSSADVIGKPLMIYDSQIQSAEEIAQPLTLARHPIRWERLFHLL